MKTNINNSILSALSIIYLFPANSCAQKATDSVDWDKTPFVSKTTLTLQLVENSMVMPSSPIHKNMFKALKDVPADYVRYVPWVLDPKMAVGELTPPAATWMDCSLESRY